MLYVTFPREEIDELERQLRGAIAAGRKAAGLGAMDKAHLDRLVARVMAAVDQWVPPGQACAVPFTPPEGARTEILEEINRFGEHAAIAGMRRLLLNAARERFALELEKELP